jgi:zinc and cadmium transporter
MVNTLVSIIIAVVSVSLISLIGVALFGVRRNLLNRFLIFLVAFAAGSFLATAFFDLIPESFELIGNLGLVYVLSGIIIFFVIESFIHWHHHEEECVDCIQPYAYINLVGDGLHNFLDGIIIAASFLLSIPTGIATTIAIGLHEIPQEFGDFAILVKGGMTKGQALLMNFVSGIFALLGGLLAFFFFSKIENFIPIVVSLAAGGFIYIAAADLFPQLHSQKKDYKRLFIQLISMLIGILLIWWLLGIFPE